MPGRMRDPGRSLPILLVSDGGGMRKGALPRNWSNSAGMMGVASLPRSNLSGNGEVSSNIPQTAAPGELTIFCSPIPMGVGQQRIGVEGGRAGSTRPISGIVPERPHGFTSAVGGFRLFRGNARAASFCSPATAKSDRCSDRTIAGGSRQTRGTSRPPPSVTCSSRSHVGQGEHHRGHDEAVPARGRTAADRSSAAQFARRPAGRRGARYRGA